MKTTRTLARDRLILPRVIEHEYEMGTLAAIRSRVKGPVIGFDVADPSFDTPVDVKRALTRALTRPDATHYTRIRGLPVFVQSVARFYRTHFGVDADPMDEVLATVGSGEGLFIVFAATVSPGDEFILPNPTFPNYASLLHLFGGIAKFVPLRADFHLDVGAIDRAVTSRTKAIVICTPNNPTGAVYTRSELAELLKVAEAHDLAVISDENYSQVTYDGKSHCSIASLPHAMERTVVINGLSKVYAMTGWRLGYVIARRDLVEPFEKVAFEIRGSLNTAVQYAGAAALRSARRIARKIVSQYPRKRSLMVGMLREAGLTCHLPEGGFEAFPEVPAGFSGSIELTMYLARRAGVLVKPGIYFGPDGDQFFRMVYCRDDRVIRAGVRRIAFALAARGANRVKRILRKG